MPTVMHAKVQISMIFQKAVLPSLSSSIASPGAAVANTKQQIMALAIFGFFAVVLAQHFLA